MTGLLTCFVVIVEEFDDPPPYGSGAILNRECAIATLSHDEAREVYDSHKEFWADKSRFSVLLLEEYVRPEMARMLPPERATGAKESA